MRAPNAHARRLPRRPQQKRRGDRRKPPRPGPPRKGVNWAAGPSCHGPGPSSTSRWAPLDVGLVSSRKGGAGAGVRLGTARSVCRSSFWSSTGLCAEARQRCRSELRLLATETSPQSVSNLPVAELALVGRTKSDVIRLWSWRDVEDQNDDHDRSAFRLPAASSQLRSGGRRPSGDRGQSGAPASRAWLQPRAGEPTPVVCRCWCGYLGGRE
jgi:hypothetical protein